MAQMRISRNAATPKGFLRRISDAGFESIDDPRRQAWVVHPLAALLKLGVLAFSSHARSVRAVEVRSEQLRPTVRAEVGLKERVSDNAFGLALPRVDWSKPSGDEAAWLRHVCKKAPVPGCQTSCLAGAKATIGSRAERRRARPR